ncbi:GntR family transcriptional regulator [Pikeienuella piscinae]|uniref:GntR family transcriptional regulator n=1 Tax=Pikeienuella piscinae TaxID=2748098 RepID=A0A7L5BTE8_9RHOB|nr:GntR family transcriptional regulator [Pikeienuella piscinae]QIE54271.1 GntR family transcriptional regulator [Pikeienuella piscinae]
MSMPTKARSRGGDLIEAIRLKILLHELRPGDGISEDALAEEFGVSRTPIREAIITLQADRLVTLERNYGAYVAADSLGAFKSYLEAAILIQSQTLALAAKRRTERNLARLAEILEEAKAHQASEASIPRILACRQFMFELARASQNPLLAEQARRMIDLHIFFRVGLARALAPMQLDQVMVEPLDDYYSLLELVRERDDEGMRAAVGRRFTTTRQLMLRALG